MELNWLKDRLQRVVLNGEASDWSRVASGVPQGSVIGPLAFIIFINDLDSYKNVVLLLSKFADDTKMAHSVLNDRGMEELQKCLNNLMEWGGDMGYGV